MGSADILIVEDNTMVAEDCRDCLISLGYRVLSIAASGEEAIRKAETDRPDAVLMDIQLRGEMDGIEAAEQIYSRFDIPVLFLSAYSDPELLQRAKRVGAFGYLLKPFEERELHAMLEMTLYKGRAEQKRRQAERELAEAKAAAETANRAKSTFLANMSHEIRTPINAVLSFSKMLKEQQMGLLNRKQLETVNDIYESGSRLLVLIDDILDLAKVEAGKIEMNYAPFALDSFVEEITNTLAEFTEGTHVSGRILVDPDVPESLIGDAYRIGQVLRNLMSNAAKFTEKGSIEVTIRRRSNDRLLFSVSDTGIGIPENSKKDLFSKFYQADGSYTKRYKGTGLGLAISKELVELMGGEIGFRSRPGAGSTFFFTVRLKSSMGEKERSREGQWQPSKAGSPETGLKILLAEDEVLNRKAMTYFLERKGYHVTPAVNGKEVLKAWEEGDYDIILMDVQMPEMDGVEATHQIRMLESDLKKRQIPIIALTAYAMRGDKEDFLNAGMNDYVSKPVDYDPLVEKINRLVSSG